MKKTRFGLILIMIFGLSPLASTVLASAVMPTERMVNESHDARARALYKEVRCVVCQNESVADSSADIAADMRTDIRKHISQGLSDTEIRDQLRARFGDYVLFRPRFSLGTALLWLLPVFIFAMGGLIAYRLTRPKVLGQTSDLSEEERQRLETLLSK
jgi:cytochrome c-type biogenesis protein CcmH